MFFTKCGVARSCWLCRALADLLLSLLHADYIYRNGLSTAACCCSFPFCGRLMMLSALCAGVLVLSFIDDTFSRGTQRSSLSPFLCSCSDFVVQVAGVSPHRAIVSQHAARWFLFWLRRAGLIANGCLNCKFGPIKIEYQSMGQRLHLPSCLRLLALNVCCCRVFSCGLPADLHLSTCSPCPGQQLTFHSWLSLS